jgi:long-subunit fatty acid transport protein
MARNDGFDPHRASPSASRVAACLAFLAAASWSTAADASGFLNPRLADPHGQPALSNPYAIYFNPAALGGIHGTEIVLDGTLVYRTVDYTRSPAALSPRSTPTKGDALYVSTNIGDAHAANTFVIPFAAAATDFGSESFFAGIGAYVPFGGAVQFDRRPEFAGNPNARGAVDGPQRWAVISGNQRSLYTTAALGFRLPNSGLSVALSGSVVLSSIQHVQARNLDGYDDINGEGRALLDVSGVEFAPSAGVFWEVLPKGKLRLGASYSLRPSLGEMRLTGTLRQQYDKEAVKDVDFTQTYPDVLRMGLAARPWGDTVELRLDAEYVTWSEFDNQCIVTKGQPCATNPDGSEVNNAGNIILNIRRHWRDTGAVHAGIGYYASSVTEVFGALGYDTSAATVQTVEATYPDSFKAMGSLGARFRLTSATAIGASTTLVHYLPVTASNQQQLANAGNSKIPNEDGEYKSNVLFFNLNASLAF